MPKKFKDLSKKGILQTLRAWTKGTLLNVQKLGQKGVSQKFKNLNEKECPFCSRRG